MNHKTYLYTCFIIGNFLNLTMNSMTASRKKIGVNSNAFKDASSNQLPNWENHNPAAKNIIPRNSFGEPIPSLTASLTTDKLNGPILLKDTNFIEIMAHFDRERIPERIVHAKGSGAYGVFTVTNDITKYTKADIFSKIGKRTNMFVRFSTVIGESGAADTVTADLRGFALKLYTGQGIWDIVGVDIPVFPNRDPILFVQRIHSRKRNPQTGLPDPNSVWDFISLRPETTHNTLRSHSDVGIPKSHRHMDGFGVNTFAMRNAIGTFVFVKFHWKTQQGLKYFTWDQAIKMAGIDPDISSRDLFNAIESGKFPTWKFYIQVLPVENVKTFPEAFDPTKIWPEDKYPLIPVGTFTLNRNPQNFFDEVEQSAFDPGNLIPGIELSPDRFLQGRSFSYADSQRYRLGANFHQIPVNRAFSNNGVIKNYNRGGKSVHLSQGSSPNYFPNSFSGPGTNIKYTSGPEEDVCGKAARYDSSLAIDNYSQANQFYIDLKPDEKTRLISNLVRSLGKANKKIQKRALKNIFEPTNKELAIKIANGLGI